MYVCVRVHIYGIPGIKDSGAQSPLEELGEKETFTMKCR